MRLFGAAALLGETRKPVRVKREVLLFVLDGLQPPLEFFHPFEDRLLFLLKRRSPREPGLCLGVCAVGRLKRLRFGLQALEDQRVEPEPGELPLYLLFPGEVALDLGDEPLPLLSEGREAAALAPESIGLRPLLCKVPDPLPEGIVRRRIIPLQAERLYRGAVLSGLGLPPPHGVGALPVAGGIECVLLFCALEGGALLQEVLQPGNNLLVLDGRSRMLLFEPGERLLHRRGGRCKVAEQPFVVLPETLVAHRAGPVRTCFEDLCLVFGQPPDLFADRLLACGTGTDP